MNGLIDWGTLSFSLVNSIHSYNLGEEDFISIFKFMFGNREKLDKAFFLICDILDHYILKIFSVLVQDFKVFSKIIENPKENSTCISYNKLYLVGAAESI